MFRIIAIVGVALMTAAAVACANWVSEADLDATVEARVAEVLAEATTTATHTASHTPTATPTLTATPTPSPAPTSTPMPTNTPMPVDDHGDSRSDATSMDVDSKIVGDIETAGDVDYFSFRAAGGRKYFLETRLISHSDTALSLYTADGSSITSDDDGGDGGAERIEWDAVDSGVYFVEVRGFKSRTGTYSLTILEADVADLVWRYQTGNSVLGLYSSPAVSDGVVYVGSNDGAAYALDEETGDLLWRYQTEDQVLSDPAVSDGVVYVGANDYVSKGTVYALDTETGDLLWRYQTGDEIWSSAAVSDGVVYIGADDGVVYALDADTGDKV